MKKTIFAGVTEEKELYFLSVDTTNNQRNGYNEFSMTGFTVQPIELEQAKNRSRESIESVIEDEIRDINPAYVRNIDDIVEDVLNIDGDLSGIDLSLYPDEITTKDGVEYVFESCSYGQHTENTLIYYAINKKLFIALMKLWEEYHLKSYDDLSKSAINKAIIDEVMNIRQDESNAIIDALQYIN